MKSSYPKWLLFTLLSIITQQLYSQTIIFSENFESGSPSSQWSTYYKNEDSLLAVPIAQAPKPLSTGGNYVGKLQDLDGSYSGSAVAVAGDLNLKDYSIEADVYVYVNQSLSAYTGIVTYADSAKKDFYKLRADFDASNRLNFSGLKADPNTFLPLFSYDYKGANNPNRFPTTDGWHKLKIVVRSTSPKENTIWSYLDDTLLTASPIVDTSSGRLTAGKFGLYSFQSDADGIPAYFDNIIVRSLPPLEAAETVVFTEDFESGKPNSQWSSYYKNEDSLTAVPVAQAPKPLATGGNYVGKLQDLDGSYSGSAVAVAGDLNLKNYSIEADVYVYVNQSLSAYTGLVVYADSAKKDFYKLRADFDVSDRLNFSGLKADPNTFLPLFSKDYKGVNNTGLFPTVDGWHKLKIEVRSTSSTENTIWSYLDGNLLNASPIVDTSSGRLTAGKFGLYSFQSDVDGIPAYFDNIVVKTIAPTAVKESARNNTPNSFTLAQNYPNPFNPETRISYQLNTSDFVSLVIYDQLGRQVKTLVAQGQSAGQHYANWNGRDEAGRVVPSGVYLYSLKTGNTVQSKKMMFLK